MRWAYGALRRYWILGVLGLAASAATGYVGYLAEREFQIRRRARLLRKRANKVNIGSIFGMDVGGTLTKIVYFEKFTDGDTMNERGKEGNEEAYVDMVTQDGGVEGGVPSVQRTKSKDSPDVASSMKRAYTSAGNFLTEDQRERRTSLTGYQGDSSSSFTGNNKNADAEGLGTKKLSYGSLARLDAPDHQASLKELYEYMHTARNEPSGSTSHLLHDQGLSFFSSALGGRLHFLNFETRNMISAINLLAMQGEAFDNVRTIACTGGGAHKYAAEVEEQAAVSFDQMDELSCLIRGMYFALTHVDDECYTYRKEEETGTSQTTTSPDSSANSQQKEYTRRVSLSSEIFVKADHFPYLVVNIGTGVSIMKINAPGVYERVSGSSVGGGTYWGLCRLMLQSAAGAGRGAEAFQHILDLAEQGDPAKVDMLVKDIYGGSYEEKSRKLDGDMVASSFGKLTMKEDPGQGVLEGDVAIALLMMITNNIGQVSYLNAQLHGCSKIFFVGSFLRHNNISSRRLSYAINFWSKGAMEALFLVHEGYFGALGAFLTSAFGKDVDKLLHMHGDDRGGGSTRSSGGESGEMEDLTDLFDKPEVGRSRALSASTVVIGSDRRRGSAGAAIGGGRVGPRSASTTAPSAAAASLASSLSSLGQDQVQEHMFASSKGSHSPVRRHSGLASISGHDAATSDTKSH